MTVDPVLILVPDLKLLEPGTARGRTTVRKYDPLLAMGTDPDDPTTKVTKLDMRNHAPQIE